MGNVFVILFFSFIAAVLIGLPLLACGGAYWVDAWHTGLLVLFAAIAACSGLALNWRRSVTGGRLLLRVCAASYAACVIAFLLPLYLTLPVLFERPRFVLPQLGWCALYALLLSGPVVMGVWIILQAIPPAEYDRGFDVKIEKK